MECLDYDQQPCLNVTCMDCRELKCTVCGHEYGAHYTTNDDKWSGCADCNDCEGFSVS